VAEKQRWADERYLEGIGEYYAVKKLMDVPLIIK
jgi:hypothetical protein